MNASHIASHHGILLIFQQASLSSVSDKTKYRRDEQTVLLTVVDTTPTLVTAADDVDK